MASRKALDSCCHLLLFLLFFDTPPFFFFFASSFATFFWIWSTCICSSVLKVSLFAIRALKRMTTCEKVWQSRPSTNAEPYLGRIKNGSFLGHLGLTFRLAVLIYVLFIDLWCERALAEIAFNELNLDNRLLIIQVSTHNIISTRETVTRGMRFVHYARRSNRRLIIQRQVL